MLWYCRRYWDVDKRYTPHILIKLRPGDVEELFKASKETSGRVGRSPKLDWNGAVKRHVFELFDYHGCLSPHDPEWSIQADVERAVADFLDKSGWEAGESTIRKHTAKFISEWKAQREGR
jgi:hypothetical protein